MKKLAAFFCLGVSLAHGSAQGLINFFNSSSTLVSSGFATNLVSGAIGSWFFGLLTSPVGSNTFSFTGVYATNQLVAGRFNGGVGVVVNGWVPGAARDFRVAGWSAALGHDFNPAWLLFGVPSGLFGVSDVGTGVAGGLTRSGTLPNLNIFGGAGGIQNGFFVGAAIPEPSGATFVGLGAGTLLISRSIGGRAIPPQRTRR